VPDSVVKRLMSEANCRSAPSSTVDRSPVIPPAAAAAVLTGQGGTAAVVTELAVAGAAVEATGATVTGTVVLSPQAIVVVDNATSAMALLSQGMAGHGDSLRARLMRP